MKAFAPVVAAVLFAASTVAVEPLVINNPPTATVCKPLTFTWSGGTPPYDLTVAQVLSNVISDPVEEFGGQDGTSFTWVVSIAPVPGGESLVLNIVDGAGNFSQSAPFEIQDSTDHSCLSPLVVNNPTPSPGTVCEPILFSWSGGTPPYTMTLAQLLSDTVAAGVKKFAAQTATSFEWVVNVAPIPGGDTFVLNVVDGAGNINQSSIFNIHDSTDHSCLAASPSGSMSISPTNPITLIPAPSPTSSTISNPPVQSTSKSSLLSEGKILGIGLGIVAALLLLAAWRVYVLRTRRRPTRNFGDTENLGIDQKIPLSPIQKSFK